MSWDPVNNAIQSNFINGGTILKISAFSAVKLECHVIDPIGSCNGLMYDYTFDDRYSLQKGIDSPEYVVHTCTHSMKWHTVRYI